MIAYYPLSWKYWQGNSMKNAPSWLEDQYDIDAKVAESDLPAWRAQGRDNTLLMIMLRDMLRERCNLLLHQQVSEGRVLRLVVVKQPKIAFTESAPSEVIPKNAMKFSKYDGSFIPSSGDLHFFSTSMEALATFLTKPSVGPIFDATNLPGRYTFVLPRIASVNDPAESEPGGSVLYEISKLGLGIRRGTAPTTTLVIDHVERPSPN